MRYLSYLLLGSLVAGSVLGWPLLPDRVPVHFGIDGEVTRWGDRTAWRWFLIPGIASLVALACVWLTRALPDRPHLINIPDKSRYLALPAERRLFVIERIRHALHGVAAQAIALLTFVQLATYRTAHGHDASNLMMAVLALSLLIVPVTLFLWLPGIQHEIERQWRAQHGQGRLR